MVLVWYQGRARMGQLHKERRKKWWRVQLSDGIWADVAYKGIEWYSELNGPTVKS